VVCDADDEPVAELTVWLVGSELEPEPGPEVW
jgi:hypothetical protein